MWTDIQKLQKNFDRKHSFESKLVSLDYAHLYSYEEKIPVTRSGHMKKPMLNGGHHDYGRWAEKAYNIKYENVVEGIAGSFKAEPVINGVKYKAKTYFPPDWTEEHTIEKIWEAFENRHSISELDTSKCYTIRGKTSEGLQIKMFLDTTIWYITTAFPD